MRFNPVRYCSGTEKFPPPSGYFAANPQPTKTGGREDFTGMKGINGMVFEERVDEGTSCTG